MAGTTGEVADASAGVLGAVTVAPYALVRTVTQAAPGSVSPYVDEYRACAARLVELTLRCERLADPLGDQLYERARSASAEVRGRVLLPLRRDVHNRRSPKASLRAALAAPEHRSPLLDTWLSARDEMDRIGARLTALGDLALRADRAALAGLCRSEDLQRAVALTSEDLLRAVRRAAGQGDAPDKQARKSEATVLRYAMRAVTRTNPLSWFSHVGWGRWEEGPRGDRSREARDSDPVAVDPVSADPVAVARVRLSLVDGLVEAVLRRREVRAAADCRLAPGLWADGSQVRYRRTPPGEGAFAGQGQEEEIALPLTPVLRLVLARGGNGDIMRQRDLIADIARRLPGPLQRAERAAADFVASLLDQQLLWPAPPFDPQAQDIVGEASRWLAGLGCADLAEALAAIGSDTEGYAHLPAMSRPARLARLRSRWSEAYTLAGAAPPNLRAPLSEDVVVPGVAPLGSRHGHAALPDLARLAPLFELFDDYVLLRRMALDRFVVRFGTGGVCGSLAEFADEIVAVREACDAVTSDADFRLPGGGSGTVTAEVRKLLSLRAELIAAVPLGDGDADAEVVLPEELVDAAVRAAPAWLRQRPSSYGVFVQPVPDGGTTRLCVNHVYGGWGRFTSRFLDHLDPVAERQVAARIAGTLGAGERIAQIRPVAGFNGNVHPRLVADEISEGGARATLRPEQLELFHDVAADQLRLRVTATGEPVSVLYLGFLLPSVLPDRWAPLVDDLGAGPADLGAALAPRLSRDTPLGPIGFRPRLRYRDLILARAQWRLPREAVTDWRAELGRDSPVFATSRRRALLGIPEHVFVAAAGPEDAVGTGALMSYLARPKSQYVDLGSALHLRCLSRTLARYPDGVVVTEALPVPTPGVRATELVAETYRSRL